MVAFSRTPNPQADQILDRFLDSALAIILEFGVESPSIDIELDLWHALSPHLTQPARPLNNLLPQLVDSAYQVALHHGARGSFLDLEMALWHAFQLLNRDLEHGPRRRGWASSLTSQPRPNALVNARQ